jgi:flagellar assembly protein FliH
VARVIRSAELAAEAARTTPAPEELAAVHVALDRARRAHEEELQAAIAAIAIAAARKIVLAEIDARPEQVRAIVKDSLDRVRRAERVRVRVCAEDERAASGLGAEVVIDPSIARGGCIVESELGEVDARLEVRLDALERALSSVLAPRSS